MGSLSTAKAVEVLFENALETYEHQTQMLEKVSVFKPNAADYQNSSNVIWRPVQQHAPIIEGWDLTGQDTGIVEQYYPATLEDPKNDFFSQRADDMRDMGFWERRGKQSGMKQATFLNSSLASLVRNTGSMFYRSNVTSGYDFVSEAQAIMNERQTVAGERCFVLNNRDTQKFGQDLAARQTLQGRPEQTWATGQIGQNIAEFDVYTGSYLGVLAGGASPDTTTTATLSFKPEGQQTVGSVEVNVDYRFASIPVVSSASYNVGDKLTIGSVNAISLADKTETGQLMTFTVVAIPDGTTLEVYPKPIALDDVSLSVEEAAYANVDTQIQSGDTVSRLNIDASAQANIFWDKDSIEVIGGDAPLALLNEFGGMKVVNQAMSNGQTMYMAYDGNIDTLNFKCRLFTWWGLNNRNPSANGVAVTY
jgi:hypothetical protein